MGKRKRVDDKGPFRNPFFPTETEGSSSRKPAEILQHIILFDELSQQHDVPDNLIVAANALSDFIRSDEECGEALSLVLAVTRNDIVSLLLSWSIQHLQRDAKYRFESTPLIVWEVFTQCLRFTWENESCSVRQLASRKFFSQSTMLKIIPEIAAFALAPGAEDNIKLEHAVCSYELLLDNYYLPTLDIACRTILLHVQREIQSSGFCNFEACNRILTATLNWILKLQMTGKGNAKTTFQLFSDRQILVALANAYFWRQRNTEATNYTFFSKEDSIQKVIDEIIADVLFNHNHHMDGFRSLLSRKTPIETGKANVAEQTKTSTFKCYQEDLFKTLSSFESDAGLKELVIFIPVIMNSFFVQSKLWYQVQLSKERKSVSSDLLSKLQFGFFEKVIQTLQCTLEHSLNTTNSNIRQVGVIMRSLREGLDLILRFDAYHPSFDNKSRDNYGILDGLTSKLVSIHSMATLLEDPSIHSELLASLQTLLRLNHLLIHVRVQDVLLILSANVEEAVTDMSISLTDSLIDTYAQLRQHSYVVCSILQAIENLGKARNFHGLRCLRMIVDNCSVQEQFGKAFYECPQDQVDATLNALIQWASSVDLRSVTSTLHLTTTASFSNVVMKSIRVEKSSASRVAKLCEEGLEKGLQHILGEPKHHEGHEDHSVDTCTKVGLSFGASCLELHDRCSFWLGSDSCLEMPQLVLRHLDTPIDTEKKAPSATHCYGEIQLLACLFLKRLHAAILKRDHARVEYSATECQALPLISQAKRLGTLVGQIANLPSQQHCWLIVAKHLPCWAPYADERSIDSFISWVLQTSFNSVGPDGMHDLAEEAISLLFDASFYENFEISSRIFRIAVSEIVKITEPYKESFLESYAIAVDSTKAHPIQTEQLITLTQTMPPSTELEHEGRSENSANLDMATRLLQFINSDAIKIGGKNEVRHAIMAAFQLDIYLRAHLAKGLRREVVLLSCTRALLAKSLKDLRLRCDSMYSGTEVAAIISYIYDSCSALGERERQLELVQGLMVASSHVVKELAPMLVTEVHENISKLVGRYRTAHPKFAETSKRVMILHRALLNGLAVTATQSIFESLCPEFWKLLNAPFEGDSKLLNQSNQNYFLHREVALFFADLVRLSRPSCDDETTTKTIKVLREFYLKRISELDPSESNNEHMLYVLASFVVATPSVELSFLVIELSLKEEDHKPLLQACFCRAVQSLDADGLEKSLLRIISESESSNIPPTVYLRLLGYVLKMYRAHERKEAIDDLGKRVFLLISNSLLVPSNCVNEYAEAQLALSLMDEVIGQRDILVLRESDVALILSRVRSVLVAKHERSELVADGGRVFDSCTKLVNTLLLRYAKQLFACAPSLISAISGMLKYVIDSPLPDDFITRRAHRFGRVCERFSAHRDIYKKHVVGLILDFVNGLKREISLARKESLLPAVYSLLDMMASHEMLQLNALMDTVGKALFRGIYQTYKKQHVYNG